MRRRRRSVALLAAGLGVLGLLTVFGVSLADTQAKSKRDVAGRLHERAVLAAALIDSLFGTLLQQVPQDEARYGGRLVSDRLMDSSRQQSTYLVLVGVDGQVLARSRGFTAQARADLSRSAALALVRTGHSYGVGDVLPYGRGGVVNLAVRFSTPYGPRVLMDGVPPGTLSSFLSPELARIPGVSGAHNFVIDGNLTVLGSSTATVRVGARFTALAQVRALARPSGEVDGRYYEQVGLENSTWRIVLTAPDGPLFASVTGLRKWIPWMILISFALVAAIAIALGRRVVLSAESDLRQANEQLAAVNDELAVSNAMLGRRAEELARSNEELEQFASIASHDLQEPLRKIRTFTEQVVRMESASMSEKGLEYLGRANNAAERMQRLIQDLLQFSRLGTHGRPFATVDLGSTARETLEDLSFELERTGARVHVGELPTVHADPVQMRQLIQNLVSNAVKFRRPGVAPEVRIEATSDGNWVRLRVTDNGIGFEPRYRDRIFRVFERLHGRTEYPGTGIGLALCRKIAERHSGTIEADGELGAGATFTVTLPIEEQPSAPAPPPTQGARAVGAAATKET